MSYLATVPVTYEWQWQLFKSCLHIHILLFPWIRHDWQRNVSIWIWGDWQLFHINQGFRGDWQLYQMDQMWLQLSHMNLRWLRTFSHESEVTENFLTWIWGDWELSHMNLRWLRTFSHESEVTENFLTWIWVDWELSHMNLRWLRTFSHESEVTENFLTWIWGDWELSHINLRWLRTFSHEFSYYCNCLKFHQYQFIRWGEVTLTRHMDRQTDGLTGWFLYTPQNFVCRGYKDSKHENGRMDM